MTEPGVASSRSLRSLWRSVGNQWRRARKLVSILARPAYFRALRWRVAATVEHTEALRRLVPRSVIDVGANKGQFTMLARALFPQAPVVAFEPLQSAAATFRRVHGNDESVTLHQVAIGAEESAGVMNVTERGDSSSLLDVTRDLERAFPGMRVRGTEEVSVATLGSFASLTKLKSPTLLKIDVQGYEREALRGCTAILPVVRWIFIELSFVELYAGQATATTMIGELERVGFRLSGVFGQVYDAMERPIQADFLFERARQTATQ